jgi:hypothetical protein
VSRNPNNIADEELDRRAAIIIQTFGGIHPPFEAFYIQSIIYSAGRAREAFQRFDVARSLGDTADYQVSSIHEGLGHCGSLSRFFWPSGLGYRETQAQRSLKIARGAKLRKAFGLTSNCLLKDRRLRDLLEHFDERLDRYLLSHDSGYFFRGAIIGDSELADDPEGNIFKLVDHRNSCFVLLGEKHQFGELRKEVERVYELAVDMDKSGCRLRVATD